MTHASRKEKRGSSKRLSETPATLATNMYVSQLFEDVPLRKEKGKFGNQFLETFLTLYKS